jgi:hypothetical protein
VRNGICVLGLISSVASCGVDPSPGRLEPAFLESAPRALDITGRVWCVQHDEGPTGDPCSNPAAFATVQEAVDAASAGDEIRIAAGIHVGAPGAAAVAIVDEPILLTGGYPGGASGWSLPTGASTSTQLDGESVREAVQIDGAIEVGLRNLLVTRGGVRAATGAVLVADYPLELGDGASQGRFLVSSVMRLAGPHALLDGTVVEGPGHVLLDGRSLDVPEGAIVEVERLVMISGSLRGRGVLVIRDAMDMLSSAEKTWRGVTVRNQGIVRWSGAAPDYDGGELWIGGILDNQPGAVFEIRTNSPIHGYSFDGGEDRIGIVNAGIVRKTTATGNTYLAADFTGGRVEVETGTITLLETRDGTGSLDITVAAGATFDLCGGMHHTYRGVLRARGDGAVVVRSGTIVVDREGLTLEGEGSTLQFDFGWIQGARGVHGEVVNRGTLNFVGLGAVSLLDVAVRNQGTMRWTTDRPGHYAGSLFFFGHALFDNQAGALVDMQTNMAVISASADAGRFVNAGTLRKSVADGMTYFDAPLSGGRVEVETGSILLYGHHETGSLDAVVAAGATLDLTGGSARRYSGELRARGDGIVTLGGGTLVVGSGGLTLDGEGQTLQWHSGAVQGPASGETVELVNRGTWNLLTNGAKTLRRVALRNQGTVRWAGDAPAHDGGTIELDGGARLDNREGATLLIEADGALRGSGAAEVVNAGVLRKAAGIGTTSLDVAVTNRGDVVVGSGTLAVGPRYLQESGATRLAGGRIAADAPVRIAAGRLEGSGEIAGAVENSGEIHPGGAGQIGQLAIASLQQADAAAIHIELAATDGATPGVDLDQLVIGTASLRGVLDVRVLSDQAPPSGVPFPVVIWGERAGAFDAVECHGVSCTPLYEASSLVLTFP